MNRKITDDLVYVGVTDRSIDLFEGQYSVPDGISYNSYVIFDEKTAVMDTVDAAFGDEWLANVKEALGGRKPDHLIVHHAEPDHSSNILRFADEFPEAVIVASAKAFTMMKNFFGQDFADRRITAAEGSTLELGKHVLTFITAPMVHWPEVIMSYDSTDKTLFTADAFGRFGDLDSDANWADEARRYYFGIVGKYGAQVQAVLKKTAKFDIGRICPLHGNVITDNVKECIGLYEKWSSYTPEENGVVIAYASMYGNTKKAALLLDEKLRANGVKTAVYDLSRCDRAQAVSDAFRYSGLVLASATYNADVFPPMREFVNCLTERGFSKRKVGFIENGSWAPMAVKVLIGMLEKCKELTFCENNVKILSALDDAGSSAVEKLAGEIGSFD